MRITVDKPRLPLLSGYAVKLPLELLQLPTPLNGVMEQRHAIFSAAPNVRWKDDVMSSDWFGYGRMYFVVEPSHVEELFELRRRVGQLYNSTFYNADRIRFYKLDNPKHRCCNFCWQVGHSRARCTKLQQQQQYPPQHPSHDSHAHSCCARCHQFHPSLTEAECKSNPVACTLCKEEYGVSVTDHVVPRCNLYRAQEVEITEESERKRKARQERQDVRLGLSPVVTHPPPVSILSAAAFPSIA